MLHASSSTNASTSSITLASQQPLKKSTKDSNTASQHYVSTLLKTDPRFFSNAFLTSDHFKFMECFRLHGWRSNETEASWKAHAAHYNSLADVAKKDWKILKSKALEVEKQVRTIIHRAGGKGS